MAIKINYYNLGDTTANSMAAMDDMELGEFVSDIMSVPDLKKVKILVNGNVVTDMYQELSDGDVIKIEALKTDSGC